jgi:hypothetical protein
MEALTIGTGRTPRAGIRRRDQERVAASPVPDTTTGSRVFPSLEQLLGENGRTSVPAMCARLACTIQLLERVVRRGTKDDAERAQLALEAWQSALSLLNQLNP